MPQEISGSELGQHEALGEIRISESSRHEAQQETREWRAVDRLRQKISRPALVNSRVWRNLLNEIVRHSAQRESGACKINASQTILCQFYYLALTNLSRYSVMPQSNFAVFRPS